MTIDRAPDAGTFAIVAPRASPTPFAGSGRHPGRLRAGDQLTVPRGANIGYVDVRRPQPAPVSVRGTRAVIALRRPLPLPAVSRLP
jgi:hypothetical protein